MRVADKPETAESETIIQRMAAPGGAEFVKLTKAGRSAILLSANWLFDGVGALKVAAEQGVIITPAEKRRLDLTFETLALDTDSCVADRPGWHRNVYVLGDQAIPKSSTLVLISRSTDTNRWSSSGELTVWRDGLKTMLAHQTLPRFLLFASFAGPLLELVGDNLNPGIELVGDGGQGKSIMQSLVASVWGAPGLDGPGFGRTWNSTLNGLENMMRDSSDGLLLLDEARHVGSGASLARRKDFMEAAVFQLAAGGPKERLTEPGVNERHRFVWISSANEHLADRISDANPSLQAAALSRVLVLSSDAGDGLGVFNRTPSGPAEMAEIIQPLVRLIASHHGKPIRRFIRRLADERGRDEGALRQRLEEAVQTFAEPAARSKDPIISRNGRTLGLVYAAGLLAVEYGVLPAKWNAKLVCDRVRDKHLPQPPPSPLELLLRHRSKVVNLDEIDLQSMSDLELRTHPGFLRTVRGRRELLLTPAQLDEHFTEPKAVLTSARARGCLVQDEGKRDLTVKRVVRKAGKPPNDRVHSFDLRKLKGAVKAAE